MPRHQLQLVSSLHCRSHTGSSSWHDASVIAEHVPLASIIAPALWLSDLESKAHHSHLEPPLLVCCSVAAHMSTLSVGFGGVLGENVNDARTSSWSILQSG